VLATRSKVCLYVQTAPAGATGGAVHSLLGVCGAIEQVGWHPHVAATEGSKLVEVLRARGIAVTPMPLQPLSPRTPWRSLQQLWHWYRLLSALRPLVIHENTFGESLAFSWIPWLLGIPYISHVRFPPGQTLVSYTLSRVPPPRVVVYNSQAIYDRSESWLRKFAPSARQIVLHNAVDLHAFPTMPPAPPPLTVGMVANFARYKGHRDFIRIAARLARRRPDVHFVVVGGVVDDPSEPLRLAAMARRVGLEGQIKFLGPRADVPALLHTFHVLVHPARFEAFGRVLIEAMAVGRPVVATDEGGPREIVQDGITGYLVAPGDVDAFAQQVLALLDDEALRLRMGKAAADMVRQRFSLVQHVRALARIYESVTSDGGTGDAARS